MASNEADERRQTASASEAWSLRLYVAGLTPKSTKAFTNLKRLCEKCLPGRYRIEVVDLNDDPAIAVTEQIMVLPTVVRLLPEPMRRVVGDLSDADRVLRGLQMNPCGAA